MSFGGDYYGGGTQSGGGGFMNGSPGSASGSPGGRRAEASHALRPVTIGQLNKATQAHPDAEWQIDGVEVGQVTVVGQVVTINQQATNCVYWLDDGSGRFESRHWIDSNNEEDADKWGGIQEGDWARVTGALKAFGNKRYVNATIIHKSEDDHEIFFHILDSIATTIMIERGAPSGTGLTAHAQAAGNHETGGGGGQGTPSAYQGQTHSAGNNPNNPAWSHLSELHQRILHFLSAQPDQDEGTHVAAIARTLQNETGENAAQISDALDRLQDEGHVYSTIDQSHFAISN